MKGYHAPVCSEMVKEKERERERVSLKEGDTEQCNKILIAWE